ncbi:MAG: PQQ-binding-like beta-propeller repeat protein, partial [Gammaproteobacteria bacterium]|nr:PQQ-binding-like beta-propeller repeat protein [Gammaproteobacteria bacterium]
MLLFFQVAAASDRAGEWPSFGRDPGGSQFSPLDQVDRSNVERLDVAWTHRSGDVREGAGFAGTSLPVTPIYTNDTLYYCTPLNRVFALDGATGAEKWVFDPDAPQPDTGEPLLDEPLMHVYCRGVAYWSDTDPAGAATASATPCTRRVFKGDSRGHLYAIDADTGLACRDFGAAAGHPGYASHTDYENYGDGFLIVNSPPAVVGDLVIVGSVVQDTIPNSKNGIVRAFDARSGKLQWEFNPIPKRLRDRVGGGNVWSTISIDPARGLVFLPTTSLSTDYYGAFRNGDSPLADATVAVDAQTGRVRWHHQLIRNDLFDYDLPGHPLLVTIRKDGAAVDVAIQQTKLGELFVFERETGTPVFPIDSMPASLSDIVGETSAP